MNGRHLRTTLGDPFSNVALEEALFRKLRVPTLRTWNNQKSVIIGRAQLGEYETDVGYAKANSIPVVRRFTAGGTVYNGPGNLNWSILMPRNFQDPTADLRDVNQVFATFARPVVEAIRECGAECAFNPPNSVVDKKGKLSGMAAYLSKDAVLCHGTLLIDADLEEVERLTKPRDAELKGRYPRSKFTKVSNCGVDEGEFISNLVLGLGIRLEPDELTASEAELTRDLTRSKYSTDKWNLGDPFLLDDL